MPDSKTSVSEWALIWKDCEKMHEAFLQQVTTSCGLPSRTFQGTITGRLPSKGPNIAAKPCDMSKYYPIKVNPAHMDELQEYLKGKEDAGLVNTFLSREGKNYTVAKTRIGFDTHMGTLRYVFTPWLREYVKKYRLEVFVRLTKPGGVEASQHPFATKKRLRLPNTEPVRAILTVRKNHKTGSVRFIERHERYYAKADTTRAAEATKRAHRLAQRDAARHRACVVRFNRGRRG